ncbi:MAG: ribosomal protein S18-alanine N-acetyltransferase [Clostridia bacterium]|nr:ribosomal protein S18-alanine N-acetyltransferase [Clostridia bacterium]
MEYTVRPVGTGQADEVCRLEQECFSDPWSREAVISSLGCAFSVSFGAFGSDGKMIGFAIGYNICGEMQILDIAVSPGARRRGAGQALLKSLMDAGTAGGAETFFLEVRRSNLPAIGLYEKLGFVKYGERKGYYSEPSEDAVVMKRGKNAYTGS